jgi:hypothetical protein
MIQTISTTLFYLVAAWCTIVGLVNQTLSSVNDLPWVAEALAGVDVTPFDPLFAIWAHWIGMFLIVAGVSLLLLIPAMHDSKRLLLIATVLSVGTVGAQVFSILSLGAFGVAAIVLPTVLALAIVAPVTGWIVVMQGRQTPNNALRRRL